MGPWRDTREQTLLSLTRVHLLNFCFQEQTLLFVSFDMETSAYPSGYSKEQNVISVKYKKINKKRYIFKQSMPYYKTVELG